MKVCILTANFGDFDRPVNPITQTEECDFYRFIDEDFPPVAGLTPRLQYRIPKTHGWQMTPGYDYYIWLDGSVSFERPDCVEWYLKQLGSADMAFFKHPDRKTAQEEADYLEKQKDHPYIKARYENGLHKEQMAEIKATGYEDNVLYASTAFVYKNSANVKAMLKEWLYTSVRYFTCDQVALPYLTWMYDLNVKQIDLDPFNNPYLTVVSRHK